ncbi:hypothetical protein IPL68_07975 [Candidatus Saccharibacteria bacterium]|nr:MAG: hypothetical protein IPL68_07975 [Candidatus Saccharibacteria bacterium]
MAWHNKKSHASSALAPKTAPKEDEKVAKLKATLDKINDPPPMERLVGAVIHADGKVEDQRPASHLEVKPPATAPLTQPKPTTLTEVAAGSAKTHSRTAATFTNKTGNTERRAKSRKVGSTSQN